MKLHKIITLLLILVTSHNLTSCNKKKIFVLDGSIHNFYSLDPIGDVKLVIQYTSLENGTYSTSFKTIDEVVADANGNFRAEFEYVSAVEFKIKASKDGYVTQEFVFDRSEWTVEDDNVLSLDMRGASSLDIHLKNNYAQDQYLFKLLDHSEGCTTCCESGVPYSFKTFIDTVYTCSLYSDQEVSYEVVNASEGESSKKTGSIFIEPGSNSLFIDLSQ